jgi:hypothetical protein
LSVLAAITALALSARLAHAQRRIQETQLQERMFDRRYAVFVSVEKFLGYVFRNDGSVNLQSKECRRFRDVRQQSEFLFQEDVINYMKGLDHAVKELYPRCVRRDQLTKMNQNDNALHVEIGQMLIDLETQFAEKRKEVFGPYLRVNVLATAARSAAQMRLNGWYRLWIVVAVMWALPVILFSYTSWPTTASISKGDVYFRMNPDDAHRLTDYYDVMAPSLGWTNEGVTKRIAELRQDKSFLAASPERQKTYLKDTDPDFAKASQLDQNAYLGNITGKTGPSVDIDGGHIIQFVQAIPKEDMTHTALAYQSALFQILRRKRAALVGQAFALWAIPIIALLAIGWAVRWVWHGFLTPN